MKQNKVKLSVVTVTYKSNMSELDLFVKSFFKYNDLGDDAKLIIVDNSPVDYRDVEEYVISQCADTVCYVSNPSNPGFGTSNNTGFKKYVSEYVLFINNDVEFQEPVFNKIISQFEPSVGCVGIHQNGGTPSFFAKITAPEGIQTDTFDDKFHFISGAFMFFKSDVFVEIGMFDENIFMYLEEFDLSERLIQHGYCTKYMSNLSFLHKVGNRKKVNDVVWIKSIPSFCYVCRKYGLDPAEKSRGLMRRLKMLLVYNILVFDWKCAKKVWNIYKAEKRIVYNGSGMFS